MGQSQPTWAFLQWQKTTVQSLLDEYIPACECLGVTAVYVTITAVTYPAQIMPHAVLT